MARPRRAVPNEKLHLSLNAELLTRIMAELYSEIESCVPRGEYQRFFEKLAREHFDSRALDLAPFAGCEPNQFLVRGHPAAISILERTLKGEIPA